MLWEYVRNPLTHSGKNIYFFLRIHTYKLFQWFIEPSDHRTFRPSNPQNGNIVGLSNLRTIEPSDYRTFRIYNKGVPPTAATSHINDGSLICEGSISSAFEEEPFYTAFSGRKHSLMSCQEGVSSLFRQVYIPTGLYSDRSLFRQVYIPTGRYSDRTLFRQVYISTGRYSDRSLFRQVDIPTGRYSDSFLM